MPDFSRFYALPITERVARLGVSFEDNLSLETADQMVENLVSTLELPLGIACHFVINQKPVWVPMAIEEPSVIAAASFMAKQASKLGGFRTKVDEPIMMGQIQLLDSTDWDAVQSIINKHHDELVIQANQVLASLVKRGGGCKEIIFKPLNAKMAVVEVFVDCRDAMGANLINTLMESLAPQIELLTGAQTGFKILSNLSDQRLARAWCEIPYASLDPNPTKDHGREIAQRIVNGYELACLSPYRAATHNKGIMNGIDAVAIATGNDWRAIEAGAHAYASQQPGGYGPLTHFELDNKNACLKARIALPLALGVVGGITQTHPRVKACHKLLGDFGSSAQALAGLMAAVGLAQNLAAMRALAAEGIQQGHMALHGRKSR
ncbi:MAG: hydroxymethylglutaryl-CoA reductase, degradative [Deltaproteobacteria bacterium]|nr:hydroxymethylglutaryl-CoA reductase, degradative [Deltaproteobacteria bacterium]